MKSHASVMSHPLHPMLIVFPSSLFPLMLLLDLVYWVAPADGLWTAVFWLALAGVATTLVAIVPGLIDLKHVPDNTRAKSIGIKHMVLGFALLALYALAAWVRWPGVMGENFALATSLDFVGVLGVSVQGYLGGTLVYKHHLAVVTEAEGGQPQPWEDAQSGAGGAAPARRGQLRP